MEHSQSIFIDGNRWIVAGKEEEKILAGLSNLFNTQFFSYSPCHNRVHLFRTYFNVEGLMSNYIRSVQGKLLKHSKDIN